MDLRAELTGSVGATVPRYRMLLPPGWAAYGLSVDTERELIGAARTRLSEAGRPDLAHALAAQVNDAIAALRSQDAFAYALPTDGSPTWILGSASLVGLRRRSTPQWTLDDIVEDVVRNRGGIPIGEGHRIVRWTERVPTEVDGVAAVSLLIHYLIPIPGSKRTQALQWTATVAHSPDLAADDPVLEAWIALFDNHIATFTWSAR